MPETDQLSRSLIPEPQIQGSYTGSKGYSFDMLKHLILIMTLLQLVIGDLRTEVMDVMEADVAGKPLQ